MVKEEWNGCIGAIYGSYDEEERRLMFRELTEAIELIEDRWLLLGDFNEVLNIENIRGQQRLTNSIT